MALREGWYLMSTSDLERELARWRGEDVGPSDALPLDTDEALAFRDRGNLPDDLGRTLRLVLRIDDERDMHTLDRRRSDFEPDFQQSPTWRVEGSRPVNVVPLRSPRVRGTAQPWWEDERMTVFEREWQRTGTVAGLRIPGPYRSFLYKTIAQLEATDNEVTVENVIGSIQRWLSPHEAQEVADALVEAQKG